MLSIRSPCLKGLQSTNLITQRLYKNVANNMKHSTTTQPAIKEENQEYEKQLKEFQKMSKITSTVRQKKPKRQAFAKNLFLGNFDTEILTYPQLEKEEIEKLDKEIQSVKGLFKQAQVTEAQSLSKIFRQSLADYSLFGLQASTLYGGRESLASERSAFLEEISNHNQAEHLTYNETFGAKALLLFGTEMQKQKYLPDLLSGNKIATLCVLEGCVDDGADLEVKAALAPDRNWILNGQKKLVVNGAGCDLMLVFCCTSVSVRDTRKIPKISAFIVEKSFGGVSAEKSSAGNLELSTVIFNNTKIPAENLLGKENEGQEVLKKLITDFRLNCGSNCISLTRKAVNESINFIIDNSNDKNRLHKTEAVRSILGEIATNLYAMESVNYLTTGLIDMYEDQDVELECNLTKVFCTEKAFETTSKVFNLLGMNGTENGHWAKDLHLQTLNYLTVHDPNDNLKILSGLAGLAYAGENIAEVVKKLRNPLFHGTFILKKIWDSRRQKNDNPSLNLRLYEYLHPSLVESATALEYCVLRLQYATEFVLSREGTDIIAKHCIIRRLADCVLDVYAMTAILGRASRSYCIGLQYSEFDVVAANSFCRDALERVKRNMVWILGGGYETNDENYRLMAKRLMKNKNYFYKSPLARNF